MVYKRPLTAPHPCFIKFDEGLPVYYTLNTHVFARVLCTFCRKIVINFFINGFGPPPPFVPGTDFTKPQSGRLSPASQVPQLQFPIARRLGSQPALNHSHCLVALCSGQTLLLSFGFFFPHRLSARLTRSDAWRQFPSFGPKLGFWCLRVLRYQTSDPLVQWPSELLASSSSSPPLLAILDMQPVSQIVCHL